MLSKISDILDGIGDYLEFRGHVKEALWVDKVSDQVEAMDSAINMVGKLIELTSPTVEDLKGIGGGLKGDTGVKDGNSRTDEEVAEMLYNLHKSKQPVATIINAFVKRDLQRMGGRAPSYELMMFLNRLWSSIFNNMWMYFDSPTCPQPGNVLSAKLWSERFEKIKSEASKRLSGSPFLKKPAITSEVAAITQ